MIPGSGREKNGNPLQYSCLGNPMDKGAWLAAVHGVARVGYDLATKQQQTDWNKLGDLILSCSDRNIIPRTYNIVKLFIPPLNIIWILGLFQDVTLDRGHQDWNTLRRCVILKTVSRLIAMTYKMVNFRASLSFLWC